MQTRVKHRGGGADSREAPWSTVEAVKTRVDGAESLGLINTGVQVGFVREDFTGAMTWVLGVGAPGTCSWSLSPGCGEVRGVAALEDSLC